MLRVALESILGLSLLGGDTIVLRPCVPAAWPGFSIAYRPPGSRASYMIEVRQRSPAPARSRAWLDDEPLPIAAGAIRIPIGAGAGTRRVRVELGADVGPRYQRRVVG